MTFTAVLKSIANYERTSACEIGIVVVEDEITIFLKTIVPERRATRKYPGGK